MKEPLFLSIPILLGGLLLQVPVDLVETEGLSEIVKNLSVTGIMAAGIWHFRKEMKYYREEYKTMRDLYHKNLKGEQKDEKPLA